MKTDRNSWTDTERDIQIEGHRYERATKGNHRLVSANMGTDAGRQNQHLETYFPSGRGYQKNGKS